MSVQNRWSVAEEVGRWPGVTLEDNGRKALAFRYGREEIGHMHGPNLAHLPVPPEVYRQLIEKGRVTPHPVVPESDWVQFLVSSPEDADELIALFRLNYDRFRETDLD